MRSAALLLAALAAGALAPAVARAQAPDARAARATTFWTALGDTTLERLVTGALDANLDLRAVRARVRAARATREEAVLDLLPTVTASSGYSRQRLASAALPGASGPLPEEGQWDAGVRMSWELDVTGRGRRALAARNALLASSEEDVRDTQVLLAAEVAGAYYELRGVQDRLAVARRNAENQRRTLQVTLDRLEAGRGTALDSERAQAQLSGTLAAIPTLEAAATAARHRIAVLLGRAPTELDAALDTAAAPRALPALPGAVAVEPVVRQRPDVRSVEERLAASSAFVSAARADYLPRLAIAGTAGYTARDLDALGNAGTPRYVVGPVVTWPLLDLGRVQAGVSAARAAEAEAGARYAQAVLRAREEVETSLVVYGKARERLRHLAEAAAASERATELARLRYEEGGSGFLEVLDAERTQLEAQDRLATGRVEAALGLVTVYRALGGRWPAAGAGGGEAPR